VASPFAIAQHLICIAQALGRQEFARHLQLRRARRAGWWLAFAILFSFHLKKKKNSF